MLNLNMRSNKGFWSCLGLCIGLLAAPADNVWADPTLSFSTVFSFDLNTTAAGVVQRQVNGVNYLYGTTTYTSRTYGGAIYRVGLDGGAPQSIYQLKETDGYNPTAGLLIATDPGTGNTYLYGSTVYGPHVGATLTAGAGTLFRVALDGSGYATLHTFDALSDTTNFINAEGSYPNQALIDGGDGYVYGVASRGGIHGSGTVFRMKLDGSVFQKLHDFAALDSSGLNSNGDGAFPSAILTLSTDGRLYGVTEGGGAYAYTTDSTTSGAGTIFSLNTDGSDFQTIYNFSALDSTSTGTGRNLYGAVPKGSLLQASNGDLIGTANIGGEPADDPNKIGYGVVFSVHTDGTPTGTALTTLHAFTGADGSAPIGSLLVSGGLIYGVTVSGTNSTDTTIPFSAYGTVFSIDTTGTFNLEHGFTSTEASSLTGGLIEANDANFYGTAAYGGACTYYGVVYRLNPPSGSATSSPYSSCTTTSSSGGGAMSSGWLWLLAALGLAPPVRRRLFTFDPI